jgi:hypothetical protein
VVARHRVALLAVAGAPSVGFAGWQRTWLAVPEATSFVAAECASGRLHVDERVVAQVIDDGGTPAPAGLRRHARRDHRSTSMRRSSAT